MSPLDFYDDAIGDPAKLKRKIATQAIRGVPPSGAAFVDFPSNGGPFTVESSRVARLAISPSGEPLESLPGKRLVTGGPLAPVDVDPKDRGILRMLANVFRFYTKTTPANEKWVFSVREATEAAQFLAMLNDNNILPPERIYDLMLQGFTARAESNGNFGIEFPFAAGDYDFYGDPAQTVGTGSTLPQLRNVWHAGTFDDPATDNDIFIKITSIADIANGNVDIQAKIGTAAAYSNTQTIKLGQWNRLFDESGDRIGTWSEQAMVFLPDPSTLVALDEFEIPIRRPSLTQTLATSRAISTVGVYVELDGVLRDIEGGFLISALWETLEAVPTGAGRQRAIVDRRGDFNVTFTPTRRIVDLDFQKAIHGQEEMTIVIDARTDVLIGATTEEFRFLIVAPRARFEGQIFDVGAGSSEKQESPVLRCHPDETGFTYESVLYKAALSIVAINDVPTL